MKDAENIDHAFEGRRKGNEESARSVSADLGAFSSANSGWSESLDDEAILCLSLEPGVVLGQQYEIVGIIGSGGMGAVYEAVQHSVGRLVAIKVLHKVVPEGSTAADASGRFSQEAHIVAGLQHPNIVTLHDFGRSDGGLLYLVMERLRGIGLHQAIAAGIDPQRAARIALQICGALEAAHAANIVHRDLKPTNVHLVRVGADQDFVKLLDFGIARLTNALRPVTVQRATLGTPRYMAPEQARTNEVDARADVYALGAVLFEMLMGRPPFLETTVARLLYQLLYEPPPSFQTVRPDLAIDENLERMVRKALEKRPEDRFQSAQEFGDELRTWLRSCSPGRAATILVGEPHEAAPTKRVQTDVEASPAKRPARRRRAEPEGRIHADRAQQATQKQPSSRLAWGVVSMSGVVLIASGLLWLAPKPLHPDMTQPLETMRASETVRSSEPMRLPETKREEAVGKKVGAHLSSTPSSALSAKGRSGESSRFLSVDVRWGSTHAGDVERVLQSREEAVSRCFTETRSARPFIQFEIVVEGADRTFHLGEGEPRGSRPFLECLRRLEPPLLAALTPGDRMEIYSITVRGGTGARTEKSPAHTEAKLGKKG